MVREQQEEQLDDWLVAAEKTTFAGYAGGLRLDLAVVRAALSRANIVVARKSCIKTN